MDVPIDMPHVDDTRWGQISSAYVSQIEASLGLEDCDLTFIGQLNASMCSGDASSSINEPTVSKSGKS